MANSVRVTSVAGRREEKVMLHNGDLVLIGPTDNDIFMVTSYTNGSGEFDSTAKYCSLIQLVSGNKAFTERASRNTTLRRVYNHFNNGFLTSPSAVYPITTLRTPSDIIKVAKVDYGITIRVNSIRGDVYANE